MNNRSLSVSECGRTFTVTTPEHDAVRLTIEDSNLTSVFINISCHRTSCSFVTNIMGCSNGLEFISKNSNDQLLNLLFESHKLWEFDSQKGEEKAKELVEIQLASLDADEVEEFWDRAHYSLTNATTRDEFASWISDNVVGYDQYDALDEMTFRRYTEDAALINSVALPSLRNAIKHGLLSA